MANSEGYHEPIDLLSGETMNRHRALVSLQEELEAVDWYDQRAEATDDAELREILIHNRDEEMEHAAMALEWLRRHEPRWDQMLRAYLFREGPIAVDADDEGEGDDEPEGPAASDGSLGIGSMRVGAR